MSKRHDATSPAWAWLEYGEGQKRPEEQRARIKGILEQLDIELFALDGWPVPKPMEEWPEEYWESQA